MFSCFLCAEHDSILKSHSSIKAKGNNESIEHWWPLLLLLFHLLFGLFMLSALFITFHVQQSWLYTVALFSFYYDLIKCHSIGFQRMYKIKKGIEIGSTIKSSFNFNFILHTFLLTVSITHSLPNAIISIKTN